MTGPADEPTFHPDPASRPAPAADERMGGLLEPETREKVTRLLTGAAALGAAIKVVVEDAHPHEVQSVRILGIPVFVRDDVGHPIVCGVTLPRWARGPR